MKTEGQKMVKHGWPFKMSIESLLCIWTVIELFSSLDFKLSTTSSHDSATACYHGVKTLTATFVESLYDLEVVLNDTSHQKTGKYLNLKCMASSWLSGGAFVEMFLKDNT